MTTYYKVIFSFTLTDGSVHSGEVQGSGGVIQGSEGDVQARWGQARIVQAMRRAAAGLPLHIYEPEPGCVKLFPKGSGSTESNPEPAWELVDLRQVVRWTAQRVKET